MALFMADMSIKAAVELGLQDMRDNPWLIKDILGNCLTNPYLQSKYGQKQIDAATEWFLNNKISIYMSQRRDKDEFPCVTISLGSSNEKREMKHMGDLSTETITLLPNDIKKPIPFVVKPFTPSTPYDPMSGHLGVSPSTPGVSTVVAGMVLVNPATGQGYIIQDIDSTGIFLLPGLTGVIGQFAVVPQNAFYVARVEHTFFEETYQIGCHAHGDPQTLLWLHSIVLYSLLRYRESLLEANGFAESTVSSSDMVKTDLSEDGGEAVWSRYITLSGQVENTWIKSPRRIIETVSLGGNVSGTYQGGIRIISNLDTPSQIDPSTEGWTTVSVQNS